MRGGVRAPEPVGRPGGLHPQPGRIGDDAEGLQGGLRGLRGRRLDGACRAGGVRRAGPALRPQHDHAGIRLLGEPGARHVSGPDAGRHRGAPRARHRGAEEDLSAEDDRGRMDRHHEPHRAPLRHGSRPAQDQGRAERRRLLCHLRHQDLHLRRRARHGGEHRPSGARPHRGRASRHQGHLALRGAEVPRERRTVRSASATASPAAPSSTRWAFTATPPAS